MRPSSSWCWVALAALLPFAGSLGGQFVAGDVEFITENPLMRAPGLLRTAFAHSYWYVGGGQEQAPYYRPLIVLLDGLNYAWFGERPFGYHLTNLLLHLVTSGLVLVLLRQWLCSERVALFAALLFALHPVQVHSVAYISGRTSILSTLFLVASMICVLEAERRAQVGGAASMARLSCALFAALALLSKESTAVLPVLAIGAVSACTGDLKLALRRHAGLWAALFGLVLAYLWLRAQVLGHIGGTRAALWEQLPPVATLLTIAKIVTWYPLKLLVPTELSYLPPFVPALDAADLGGILSLLALLGASAWVLFPSGGQQRERFLLFWLLVALTPVSGIVSLEYYVKEHHAYLPSIGFLALLAGVGERGFAWLEAQNQERGRMLAVALSGTYLCALSATTLVHVLDFRDPRALVDRVIELEHEIPDEAFAQRAMSKSAQRFAISHLHVALDDLKRDRCDDALPHLTRAETLARSPDIRYQAQFLNAECKLKLRDLRDAQARFEALLEVDPKRPDPALRLAWIAHETKRVEDERRYMDIACKRGAKNACAYLERSASQP